MCHVYSLSQIDETHRQKFTAEKPQKGGLSAKYK